LLPVICGDELAEPARRAALAAEPDIWTCKVKRRIDSEKKKMMMFLMVKVAECKRFAQFAWAGRP